MPEILGVRFREVGKINYYYCDIENILVKDIVIVLTKRGLESGLVMVKKNDNRVINSKTDEERIVRKATYSDLEKIKKNNEMEQQFFKICKEKILEHNLEMKLVSAQYLFDRSKLVFYFVSDGRVDFRNFVREIAYIFKTRIELRQIGVRDESKMLGGLGICGKPLCCSTFLNEFQSVSVKMAKDQGLSLSPSKISGICGRLMCCLKYEEDAYLDILYDMPSYGTIVKTKDGTGKVISHNAIMGTVKVALEKSQGGIPLIFKSSEIEIIRDQESLVQK